MGAAINESTEQPNPDRPVSTTSANLDAIFLALWRRALEDGAGLDLTLTEAAALLGTTTQTLRRRIQRDEIQTRRDSRGRLRVIPLLGVSAELVESGDGSQASVARLFEELKRYRADLAVVQSQRDALREELQAAREALIWAQDELAARSSPGVQSWPIGQPADVEQQRQERARLESKIGEARKLAGRRKWLGLTVTGWSGVHDE